MRHFTEHRLVMEKPLALFMAHLKTLLMTHLTTKSFKRSLTVFVSMMGLSATLVSAHEYQMQQVRLAHPFAIETPPGAQTGAAYLDITNQSDEPITLRSARTHIANSVELHSMSMSNHRMTMREINNLTVDAGETLKMRPGNGVHLMLIGLQDQLRDGDAFELWLTFEGYDEIPVEVRIQQRDAAVKAADSHHH